jgi:hypothetical protein
VGRATLAIDDGLYERAKSQDSGQAEVSREHTRVPSSRLFGANGPGDRSLEKVEDDEHEKTDDPRSDGHQTNRAVNRIFHGGGGE